MTAIQENTDTTGKNKERKIEPCVRCFNFKTLLIRISTLNKFLFKDNKALRRQVFNKGITRVWYCKPKEKVYIHERYALIVTDSTCGVRDT